MTENKVKIGQIIHNSNGYDYVIIAHEGSYTLLQRLNCSIVHEPYIVAWGLNEYKSGWCWGQGYYFTSIGNALKLYNEKIGKIEEPTKVVEPVVEEEVIMDDGLSFDEVRCLDCGTVYGINEGNCPNCGSGYIDFGLDE